MPTAKIIWKKRMTLAGNVHYCPRDLSTVDIEAPHFVKHKRDFLSQS